MLRSLAVLALLWSGCSGSKPDPAKTPEAAEKKDGAAKVASSTLEHPEDADFRYDPAGKPDPFQSFIRAYVKAQETDSPTGPLEQFDLSQLSVSAVVWHTERRRALVNDPAGKGYIVSEGTPIGKNRGRVIRIDDNLVLVKETYVDFHGKATTKDIEMRLHPSQGG